MAQLTSEQMEQFLFFTEEAARMALGGSNLDEQGLRQLMKHAEAFSKHIKKGIEECSANNRPTRESPESVRKYPLSYQPKSVSDQIACLHTLFPTLRTTGLDLSERTIPSGADRWIVVPRWRAVAPTYNIALESVLRLIHKARDGQFHNSRQGRTGPNCLRQIPRTAEMTEEISVQQKKHNFLIFPAQFGFHHQAKSASQARKDLAKNEFGLDAFTVGIMLLTHPEYLKSTSDLWINCLGDECDRPHERGRFGRVPCYRFRRGMPRFGTCWVDIANEYYGCATGFLPT